jgi:hypothetical protein
MLSPVTFSPNKVQNSTFLGDTAVATRHLGPIEVERIFLYEENPRHEPIESEPAIIEHLCKDEQVYNLAPGAMAKRMRWPRCHAVFMPQPRVR